MCVDVVVVNGDLTYIRYSSITLETKTKTLSWPTMFRWLCAYTLVNYTHSRTRYTYTHTHMYITATLLYRTFPFTVNIHLYGVDPCGFVKCVVIAVQCICIIRRHRVTNERDRVRVSKKVIREHTHYARERLEFHTQIWNRLVYRVCFVFILVCRISS